MNNSEGIGSANARFAIGMFIQQSGLKFDFLMYIKTSDG